MATIVLQAAGALVGGLVGGPFGAVLGRAAGGLAGAAIDGALLSGTRRVEGPRLAEGRVNGADEGTGIARVYGTARVAGQVIWATRFEESRQSERQGGKGGAPKVETTSYSYFANLAIGLCQGPIAGIRRVWADGEELDLSTVSLRLHEGTENQAPDPLIEARQGRGNAPAYRGLAYVVFERLALERWGNRVPQIACEVIRPVGRLERSVRAVTIIPGASEHGLDPRVVRERIAAGEDRLPNRNVLHGASDFEASVAELAGLCPGLKRAALVTAWFGDDLRVGRCRVRPGVEVRERDETEDWRAGDVGRAGAHLVSTAGGGPAYCGTPSEAGVVRAMAALKARGLKVTYYPFLLMDVAAGNALPDPHGGSGQAAYPWRGRMTLDVAPGRAGSAERTAAARADVERFLGGALPSHFRVEGGRVRYSGPAEWSYRRMVLHQAHVAKLGGADAFVIGSEMRGLTSLCDEAGRFPFVEGLVRLAGEMRAILPGATITYAADWSEYAGYRPADGSGDVFFQLDALWAHPAIDAVGIDNYMPLSDWREADWADGGPEGARSPYDGDALRRGIAGGEDFDWHYPSEADRLARRRVAITDGAAGKPWVFRQKDLAGWWNNRHVERRGGVEVEPPTAWMPGMKPIWFTELGCPAIDKGPNQPNVFIDPKSSESFAPRFSNGARDEAVQRRFLEAHLDHWTSGTAANSVSGVYGGPMVDPEAIHLWTWDARPFPAFPDREEVWSDGGNWRLGHWLSGRLGSAPAGETIEALLADHGIEGTDASAVDAALGGYVLAGPGTARAELEELLRLVGATASQSGGRLVFRSLAASGPDVAVEELAEEGEAPLMALRRGEADEAPEEVVVGFSDPARSYQPGTTSAGGATGGLARKAAIELPVVLAEEQAAGFALRHLRESLAAQDTARFALPPTRLDVEPGDRLVFRDPEGHGPAGRWLVTRVEAGEVLRVEARRLAEPGAAGTRGSAGSGAAAPVQPSRPVVHVLDLPAEGGGLRAAGFARPWTPLVMTSADEGGSGERVGSVAAPAVMGTLAAELRPGPEAVVDRGAVLDVRLRRGGLESVSRERLLGGANLCAVLARTGGWELMQFEGAEEVEPMRFRLSGLIRAKGGTDDAMRAGAEVGAAFVLLDAAAEALGGGLPRGSYVVRVVPAGRAMDDPAAVTAGFAFDDRAGRPLSPVHLRGHFAADGGLALSWVRRSRTGADSWDGLDVPLGEDAERYRVRIEAAGGAALVLESDAPRLDVTAAMQAAAFGGLPAGLDVGVAQIGPAHGFGTERRARFERS